jgi:hypothetical protein
VVSPSGRSPQQNSTQHNQERCVKALTWHGKRDVRVEECRISRSRSRPTRCCG